MLNYDTLLTISVAMTKFIQSKLEMQTMTKKLFIKLMLTAFLSILLSISLFYILFPRYNDLQIFIGLLIIFLFQPTITFEPRFKLTKILKSSIVFSNKYIFPLAIGFFVAQTIFMGYIRTYISIFLLTYGLGTTLLVLLERNNNGQGDQDLELMKSREMSKLENNDPR